MSLWLKLFPRGQKAPPAPTIEAIRTTSGRHRPEGPQGGTFLFDTTNIYSLTISTPQLWVPDRVLPVARNSLRVTYRPERVGGAADKWIPAAGGHACWLWEPGTWFFKIIAGPNLNSVDWSLYDVTSVGDLLWWLTDRRGAYADTSADLLLAAGVDSLLFDGPNNLHAIAVVIFNTGANEIRISFGGAGSPGTGYPLRSREVLRLEGPTMTASSIHAFSVLGSSVNFTVFYQNN